MRFRPYAALATMIAVSPVTAAAEQFSGQAAVIDGDSLMVGDKEVRLFGIDAPEATQMCSRQGQSWPCGAAASEQLGSKVSGFEVRCTPTGTDRHGRTVARCRTGDTDLNRYMVASGYALAYRRYSSDYVAAEETAKVNKRGIWSGTFELPSEVRHGGEDYKVIAPPPETRTTAKASRRPVRAVAPRTHAGGCNIKGNHSRRGEWIYHLPGMPYYEQTRAEAMFCTEAEARAAGYRRSRADQHR